MMGDSKRPMRYSPNDPTIGTGMVAGAPVPKETLEFLSGGMTREERRQRFGPLAV